jgi:hypothetical protein
MPLASDRWIRYALHIHASATETPHPSELIEPLGRVTRRKLGGGLQRVALAGRSLV